MKSTSSFFQKVRIKRALLLIMLAVALIKAIYNQNYLYALMYLGFITVGLVIDESLLLSLIIGTGVFSIMS